MLSGIVLVQVNNQPSKKQAPRSLSGMPFPLMGQPLIRSALFHKAHFAGFHLSARFKPDVVDTACEAICIE